MIRQPLRFIRITKRRASDGAIGLKRYFDPFYDKFEEQKYRKKILKEEWADQDFIPVYRKQLHRSCIFERYDLKQEDEIDFHKKVFKKKDGTDFKGQGPGPAAKQVSFAANEAADDNKTNWRPGAGDLTEIAEDELPHEESTIEKPQEETHEEAEVEELSEQGSEPVQLSRMSKISVEQSQQSRGRRGSVDVGMELRDAERDPIGLDEPAAGDEDLAEIDKMSTLRDLKGKLKEQGFELNLKQMSEPVDQTKDVLSELRSEKISGFS